MTDEQEEEQHYHDHSGPDRTCLQCRESLKESLAKDLVLPIVRMAIQGTDNRDLADVVRAIDSILDEWPR